MICAGIYANAQGYDKVDLLINSQDGVYQKYWPRTPQ